MKIVHNVKDIQKDSLQKLRIAILEEVAAMQEAGCEVDIQYSAVGQYNFTALVVSYYLKEEKRDNWWKKCVICKLLKTKKDLLGY